MLTNEFEKCEFKYRIKVSIPEYANPFKTNIRGIKNVVYHKHCQNLKFNYNNYEVSIYNSYLYIDNVKNILIDMNDIWCALKFPGFVTKYEIIQYHTMFDNHLISCDSLIGLEKLYTRLYMHDIMPRLLLLLNQHRNYIFHYIPLDVIHVMILYLI